MPLLSDTGIDAWAILCEQKPFARRSVRVFPYSSRSISTAFTRACPELKIKDLRFHDLRHESTTRCMMLQLLGNVVAAAASVLVQRAACRGDVLGMNREHCYQ